MSKIFFKIIKKTVTLSIILSIGLSGLAITNEKSKENTIEKNFLKPIDGEIITEFGWRKHPIFKKRTFHSGIDIAGPIYGDIKAANSGTVIYADSYGGYGKTIIVEHDKINGQTVTTLQSHLDSIVVEKGQKVNKGDIIAKEGSTGHTKCPSVHFEVRLNNKPQNPKDYLGN